ncbi:N-acetylglucosamine-6-phosphate deacetylase [Roseivivax sp. CAU 1761]
MTRTILAGARVFDGARLLDGFGLVIEDGRVAGLSEIGPRRGAGLVELDGGILAPGLVDLQVNGGGGALFNAAPTLETLRQMARAHAGLGATALLPTLITDRPERGAEAIAAVREAVARGVPGIAGLHLEGPHLAPSRKGAHDAGLIRPMTAEDLERLCAAAAELPSLLVTLAPEAATPEQIAALVGAGAVVSLGHSDCSAGEAAAAGAAGATMVTHLYNAMSPLGHRAPGLVGAALAEPALWAGIIADGVHVDPAALRVARLAKPDRLFLVSDAMAPAGTSDAGFTLNGRAVLRRAGRLTLADGTLAGADLDLPRAMRVMRAAGAGLEEALAMATSRPAAAIGRRDLGLLRPGARADLCHFSEGLELCAVWQGGRRMPLAPTP